MSEHVQLLINSILLIVNVYDRTAKWLENLTTKPGVPDSILSQGRYLDEQYECLFAHLGR